MTTIIIGAGACGLACAIRLKQKDPGARVVLLERLGAPGKKLLATGNGRCNLSNERAENRDTVLAFFASLGLATRTDAAGRIYPYSLQAQTVLQVLLDACQKLGVEMRTDCTVRKAEAGFTVYTDAETLHSDALVVACGGQAQPNLGSDGSGYRILKEFGHTCTPLRPALVQLTSPSKHPRALKGLRVRCHMSITLDGETAGSEAGEVLFTEYGLSGIAAMNLSAAVADNFAKKQPKKCHAVLDFAPDFTEEALLAHWWQFGSVGGVTGFKLAALIERQAGGDPARIAHFVKNWKLILDGTKGFAFAQMTNGGVPTSEFSGFASTKTPGLYACGEVLDRQFPCGGFNLNFAFYSGITAADQITGKKKTDAANS